MLTPQHGDAAFIAFWPTTMMACKCWA